MNALFRALSIYRTVKAASKGKLAPRLLRNAAHKRVNRWGR